MAYFPASSHTTPWSRAPLYVVGIGLVIVFLVTSGVRGRNEADAVLRRETLAASAPTVSVVHAKAGPAGEEVVLPGQVKGWVETPIYARTSDYLLFWNADIGAHVDTGTLLAVIDSPEVDQQLLQAQADLNSAQATAVSARSNAKRAAYLVVNRDVSKQEEEDRTATADAATAQVEAHEADVARLRQLKSFERIVAPFSGIITKRSTDVGALVNAGGQGAELFRIAEADKKGLRRSSSELCGPDHAGRQG